MNPAIFDKDNQKAEIKKIVVVIGLFFLAGWTAFSIFVELEADYFHQYLCGEGKARALVLFHPSKDFRFSDDISLAFADGGDRESYLSYIAVFSNNRKRGWP